MLTSVTIIATFFTLGANTFEVVVDKDQAVFQNDRVTLRCQARDLYEDLEDCIWRAPNGDEYRAGRRGKGYTNYVVIMDARYGDCDLTISNALEIDGGAWICALQEIDGETIEKYAFLNVMSDSLPLLQAPRIVRAGTGDSIDIICPTNTKISKGRRKVACSWSAPGGLSYKSTRSLGDGVRSFEDISRGQCGITIDRVQKIHFGQWKCKVLGPRRDGKLGSEIVTGTVGLADRYRTSRLNDEDNIQGYVQGDEDVLVSLELDITNDQVEDSKFFWVMQRSFLVPVDKDRRMTTECPRWGDCFTSFEVIKKPGERDVYIAEIQFDRLSRDDIENPVVLVREFRKRGQDKQYEVHYLPKYDLSSLSNEGCVVNDRFLQVDEEYEDEDLCVIVTCDADGEVTYRRLRRC